MSHNAVQQECARLRRDLAAVKEALALREAEVAHARPVADAGHVVARMWEDGELDLTWEMQQLVAAHQATTPSETPPEYVVVSVAERDRLWASRP